MGLRIGADVGGTFTDIVIELADGTHDVSLHLRLPGPMPLDQAHDVAEQVELAVTANVAGIGRVQTHLEPLKEQQLGREVCPSTMQT